MVNQHSIKKIASQLNVSISTISAVLNGKTKERRISPILAKKVEDYLKEIKFTPNKIAQNLRKGKSNILGVILENIADPFFAVIARSLEIKANKFGYKILFSSSENNPEIASALLQTYKQYNVDAYIIAPPLGIEDQLNTLINEGKIIIVYDRGLANVPAHNVLVNNFDGVVNATSYLIEKGRKEIALITLNSNQSQMQDRLNGYKKAIKTHQLKSYILKLPYEKNVEVIKPRMLDFLKKYPNIDAILFTTNYLTSNGLHVLKLMNKAIPEDIAVIGYDDNHNFKLYTPSITAVQQPIEEVTDKIIEIIETRTKNKEIDKDFYFATKLIERDSTK
ncbi:LacI family DNA-binding transcriptional regulator [Rhizosphaericola mali]|uniref:LacI family transcriptional regulator n=1 Tax=Rhizosphaericola mali TaxID=2545455 RepID=A0A5P2FXL0_9BACT|nr:LacI family DNA-binding transcriptional regulator [Rhizosphaericola mali]QES87128.1 LacI family transcriptional regulator [Rhizosphaericola mali]